MRGKEKKEEKELSFHHATGVTKVKKLLEEGEEGKVSLTLL